MFYSVDIHWVLLYASHWTMMLYIWVIAKPAYQILRVYQLSVIFLIKIFLKLKGMIDMAVGRKTYIV